MLAQRVGFNKNGGSMLDVVVKPEIGGKALRRDLLVAQFLQNAALLTETVTWLTINTAKLPEHYQQCVPFLLKDIRDENLIVRFMKYQHRDNRVTQNSSDYFTIRTDGKKFIGLSRLNASPERAMILGANLAGLYFNNIYLINHQDAYKEYLERRNNPKRAWRDCLHSILPPVIGRWARRNFWPRRGRKKLLERLFSAWEPR